MMISVFVVNFRVQVTCLTGSQLAWVRGFMGLAKAELAKRLAFNSHATISGWEAQGQKATGMDACTEYCLRLEMCRYVRAGSDQLVTNMPAFMDMSRALDVVRVVGLAA